MEAHKKTRQLNFSYARKAKKDTQLRGKYHKLLQEYLSVSTVKCITISVMFTYLVTSKTSLRL